MRTAERLYAERGLSEVSNRQIVEAAGQGNNSALAYHVGTRADLIRAIARSHAEPVARHTQRLLAAARGSTNPRDHVACLVQAYTAHLAELGHPGWCARFTAQISADPAFGQGARSDPLLAPLFTEALDAVAAHVPELPPEEAALRGQTMRLAIIHTCAEQERAAARTGTPTDWTLVGEALTDAITGLLQAPRRPDVP